MRGPTRPPGFAFPLMLSFALAYFHLREMLSMACFIDLHHGKSMYNARIYYALLIIYCAQLAFLQAQHLRAYGMTCHRLFSGVKGRRGRRGNQLVISKG